jgi:hypothetical protein
MATGNRKTNDGDSMTPQEFARNARQRIDQTASRFGREGKQTREMAETYFRLLSQRLNLSERDTPPSPEEVRAANEQLKDVARVSIFASVSIIPAGAVSLVGLELLARSFGVKSFTLVPSSFRKENESS